MDTSSKPESAFIDGAYSSYECGSFALVAVQLVPLVRFPQRKVGIVIYKGRKSPWKRRAEGRCRSAHGPEPVSADPSETESADGSRQRRKRKASEDGNK